MAVGEKSDVSDPVEAVGDGVLKEAADEFVGREPHDLGFAVLAANVGDERRAVFRRPVSRRLFPVGSRTGAPAAVAI